MTVTLLHGDCLELLPTLPDKSVDAIITDLPYGTTDCHWDEVIPLVPMWEQVKRLLKERRVFVTTSSQPFTTILINSNFDWFKYEFIWKKSRPSGFLHSKNAPLKAHENIIVFSNGIIAHDGRENRMIYNPQFSPGKPYKKFNYKESKHNWGRIARPSNHDYLKVNDGHRYPTSVLEYGNSNHGSKHPTRKPVALYEYLVRTYTNEGDTVLDFCMGSGTTGVACVNTGRNFIGIEKEVDYFHIAERRIGEAQMQIRFA